MKKQARKLSLRRETVRQLDRLALPDVAGGAVITFFTLGVSCDDPCPSVRVKCNTTPNGGVQ
jgi:hypothetical protein